MAKTSAIASTHGSSRPGLWATPLRLNHRLNVMKSEATVGWRRWWCNLRSTPSSFIMMRLSVIQKSCVLVAGFSCNRKRVTSPNKNWKLLIIDTWRQKQSAAAGARPLRALGAGQPLFFRDYSTLAGHWHVVVVHYMGNSLHEGNHTCHTHKTQWPNIHPTKSNLFSKPWSYSSMSKPKPSHYHSGSKLLITKLVQH